MGEGAGGDGVDAAFSDGADRIETDGAGGFDGHATGDHPDGLAHLIWRHVVEQHAVDAADLDHLPKLIEGLDLDFDLDHVTGTGAGDGRGDAAGDSDVVVLDQNAVAIARAADETA